LFFKQRVIWLPKVWLIIVMLLIVVTMMFFVFKNSALYLASNEPTHSQYLVVEGWQSEQSLLQALKTFREGNYQYLITTGGPDNRIINPKYKSFAEESATFLLAQGIAPQKIFSVSAPASAQNRTFLSAVMVREWFDLQNKMLDSLDVFTEGVHARRTRVLYQLAFGDKVEIGVYASSPENYNLDTWWQTSSGAKSVITEVVGMIWVTCCFNPGEQGSHQEKWGIVKGN
jgi:hypothetical protein